jgi:hypothetical protein
VLAYSPDLVGPRRRGDGAGDAPDVRHDGHLTPPARWGRRGGTGLRR